MKRLLVQQEGVVLVVLSPFLLFPTVFIPGTAAALILLAVLWLSLWTEKRQPWPASPLNGALLVWAAAVLVGVLVSAEADLTLPKTTGLLLGVAVLRYLTAGDEDDRRLRGGFAAFFVSGLVIVSIGAIGVNWRFEVSFVELLSGWLPPHLITLPESPAVGIHMNELAGAMLPYPLVFISLLWGWRPARYPRLIRGGLVLLTILLLALLLLTQSRSGWLGLAGGLAGLIGMNLWWSFPGGRRWLVGSGIVLAAVFLVAAVLYTRSEGWAELWQRPPQETVVGDLSTLDFRREVWLWGVTAVEELPLTGTGLGTFRRVAPERYPIAVPSDFDIAHAHNIFLQVALDTGLPGLVAYVSLLVIIGGIGWRVVGRRVEFRPLVLGLLAALVALHVYGLGDALAPGAKPAVVFWLMLGLIAALGKRESER